MDFWVSIFISSWFLLPARPKKIKTKNIIWFKFLYIFKRRCWKEKMLTCGWLTLVAKFIKWENGLCQNNGKWQKASPLRVNFHFNFLPRGLILVQSYLSVVSFSLQQSFKWMWKLETRKICTSSFVRHFRLVEIYILISQAILGDCL